MPWSSGTYTKWNASNVPPNWVGDASVGIKIEASRHDTQDDDFAAGINNCLTKDGQNTPSANLPMAGFKHTNVAAATSSNEYATLGQLQSLIPPGAITAYGAAAAPTGWLLCNGASVSTTTYAALHAVIGYTYGGSGASFNLPDLQQRFPLGKNATGTGTGAALGQTGGSIDHAHTVAGHYHSLGTLATITSGGHGHTFSGTVGGSDGTHSHSEDDLFTTTTGGTGSTTSVTWRPSDTGATSTKTINSTGSGHGHGPGTLAASGGDHNHSFSGSVGNTGGVPGDIDQNTFPNNPPFLVVNYIIKT